MDYQMSAVAMLETLGYGQPAGREWLETLEREKQLPLPKAYCAFMELAADCPLFGTSNLWVGKMAHGVCTPGTVYERIQEAIDNLQGRWSKRPGKYERMLCNLSQLPKEEWPSQLENYLLIGSDYAGGIGDFGIRVQDLTEEDPAVYWRKDSSNLGGWKLENEKLSDFLRGVLIEALACVDYQTAETALEERGWRYEDYFDIKKGDWSASKAVLKRYGIQFSELKRYQASSGKVFCCYDPERNVFFAGALEGGEISLSAINRKEAENIFLDMESFEFTLEEARLCIKDKNFEDEISPRWVYSKTPKPGLALSDACIVTKSPQEGGPDAIIWKGPLYALCSGEKLLEVVAAALKKKPKASNAELAEAFNQAVFPVDAQE